MKNATCITCGSPFVARTGSKFCSIKCKNKHHNENRKKKTDNSSIETNNQASKNVSLPSKEQVPPKRIVEKFKTETFAYVVGNSQLNKLKTKQQEVIQAIEKKNQQLQSTQTSTKLESIAIGAMAGSAKGVIGIGLGAVGGILVDKWLNRQQVKEQPTLILEIKQLKQVLSDIDRQIAQKEQELKSISRYQEMERMVDNPAYLVYQLRKRVEQDKEQQRKAKEAAIDKNRQQKKLEQERQAQEERQKLIDQLEYGSIEVEAPLEQPKTSSGTISSLEFKEMRFTELKFEKVWEEFLGRPSPNFYMVIHGAPGNGKSTFAVRFSNYLSLRFGRVLYVSSEEGLVRTLHEKFKKEQAFNANITIATYCSLEDITSNVKGQEYDFILLDSINNMGINAAGMKMLKKHFAGKAVIAIAQETKDGKMKGQNEIVHDCDITVVVNNGIATTTKNRYQEKYREYKVF